MNWNVEKEIEKAQIDVFQVSVACFNPRWQ